METDASVPSGLAAPQRVLLIIAGGIAAYKALELIRRLRERDIAVRCVLTAAGAEFVTPLSVAALSGERVYRDLFSLTEESEMGHIRLSREADLVVVAPATADLMAKLANGHADDLASTALLATDKPVLLAPAMNVEMWRHPATQRNLARLKDDGVRVIGPESGDLACGEVGAGRMAEPHDIAAAVGFLLAGGEPLLAGRHALVTSGPTREAVDPVRFISNRSSGKQGHAIAAALARFGATTTLVAGPTALGDPPGVRTVHVESAQEMAAACEAAMPADIAVCAAAVADWQLRAVAARKIKKRGAAPAFDLVETPDILATVSRPGPRRPRLVVGFAAETGDLIAEATAKRRRKGCDWILANDVAATPIFGADTTTVHLITATGAEAWPRMSKIALAERLARRIAAALAPAAAPSPA
ncbi:MAG: bifunctional phosphopantothenoylcysteine decarboxylase/phosphopantothenate--cysteine ligase CoaBC [Alphaproteobacteria bacterium]|nr:bifunctional phosphopantothenoylcysteine decarboxylase/phosphopantothenate--cysteine ligase CoaBC [Alphaproteobacteria bacterium]